ncbi:MAG: hypothetical protein AB1585_18245, partial [Thermodesulfobacteriota bacterium]
IVRKITFGLFTVPITPGAGKREPLKTVTLSSLSIGLLAQNLQYPSNKISRGYRKVLANLL